MEAGDTGQDSNRSDVDDEVIISSQETTDGIQEIPPNLSVEIIESSDSSNAQDSAEGPPKLEKEPTKVTPGSYEDFPLSLPAVNAPEKIILIIDSAQDENYTPFKVSSEEWDPLDALKRAVEMFVNMKAMINKEHEFALVILTESDVVWTLDFTKDIKKFTKALNAIKLCEIEDIFNLNKVFALINEKIKILDEETVENVIIPPQYIVRAILLYGRSYTMLEIERSNEVERLLNSSYFTFDVLMTHEPMEGYNNASKIFNTITDLDKKGFAYAFAVNRDFKELQDAMARLLGHPLQRPTQSLADYKIC